MLKYHSNRDIVISEMEKKLLGMRRRNRTPVQGDQKWFISVSVEHGKEKDAMEKGTLKTKWIMTFKSEDF